MNFRHITGAMFSAATIGIVLLLAGCGGSSNYVPSPIATATTGNSAAGNTPASGAATSILSDPATMLDTAITNSGKASSVHAKSQIVTGGQTELLEGDFGNAAIKFTITQGNGRKVDVIISGQNSGDIYLSSNGGQSWAKGDPNNVSQSAQLVLTPFSGSTKLSAQGPVSVIGSESVNGVPTSHVQIGGKSPIDVWIGDDKGKSVVYKIHLVTIDSTGSDYDVTTVYSNYGATLNIQTPTVSSSATGGSVLTPTP